MSLEAVKYFVINIATGQMTQLFISLCVFFFFLTERQTLTQGDLISDN